MNKENEIGGIAFRTHQPEMDLIMQGGCKKELEPHRYREEDSIRKQQVGNWIVSLQKKGFDAAVYIYDATTLQERFKMQTMGLNSADSDPEEVKEFHRWILENDFNRVVSLAESWNHAAGH